MGISYPRSRELANSRSYNTRVINTSTARVEEMAAHLKELERLPEILQQLENTKTAQLSPPAPHGALDRAGVRIDYRFALRHYIDSAVSVCLGINTPSTLSFQVSALETSSSLLTLEYSKAPISQTSSDESRRPSRKCTQILVRNVGLYQTMAFQVAPEYTIGTIKSLVCERVGLENAKFELLYSGSVLSSSDKSIDEYGISHDATLTCISFRPTDQPPAPCREFLACVVIKTLTGTTFRLSVEPQSLVRDVKVMSADRLKLPRPEDIRLIYGGKQLADHGCMSECGIGNLNTLTTLYLVPRLGGPPAAFGNGDAHTGTESALLESPKPQGEGLAPPRSTKAKSPALKALLSRKMAFGIPLVPRRGTVCCFSYPSFCL